MSEQESELLYKTSCEECGSSDANAVYDDGHTYCHKCEHYGKAEGEEQRPAKSSSKDRALINGEIEAIPARNLSREVCEKYGYEVGIFDGNKCHIAPYRDETGRVVAQKVRGKGKTFTVLGDLKKALPLFGQHLCRDGGKMLVITEGEIDAMAVTQAMGLSWPAVSIPNGAGGAKKSLIKAMTFIEKFDKVVFCFDNDEAGQEALDECLPLMPPGKAYVATFPAKDAGEMVETFRSKELVDAVWSAAAYRPKSIVELQDIMEEAATDVQWGLPWPWLTMTKNTYGIRRGALYVWGSGTGSGKTTLMKQLMASAMMPVLIDDHSELGITDIQPRKIASLFFEEAPSHTLRTLAGMVMGKRVHVPGVDYDRAKHREIMEGFQGLLYPIKPNSRSWEDVKATIRFLYLSEGVEDFFIDPMTALVATVEDERRALDAMMSELAGLAEELHITIHLVSHLSTPEGKSHEDGGRITEKHFRGSRSVAYWAHYMMGLERNKQDPNCPTSVRGLKDRLTGDAVGVFCAFTYNKETGLMEETEIPSGDEPFKDETQDDNL